MITITPPMWFITDIKMNTTLTYLVLTNNMSRSGVNICHDSYISPHIHVKHRYRFICTCTHYNILFTIKENITISYLQLRKTLQYLIYIEGKHYNILFTFKENIKISYLHLRKTLQYLIYN
jgi:hypothetical protein